MLNTPNYDVESWNKQCQIDNWGREIGNLNVELHYVSTNCKTTTSNTKNTSKIQNLNFERHSDQAFFSEREKEKLSAFCLLETVSPWPAVWSRNNRESGNLQRICPLQIQSNFYNRFLVPNKHQILSIRFDDTFWGNSVNNLDICRASNLFDWGLDRQANSSTTNTRQFIESPGYFRDTSLFLFKFERNFYKARFKRRNILLNWHTFEKVTITSGARDIYRIATKAWFKRRILHAPNQILILVDSNDYIRLIWFKRRIVLPNKIAEREWRVLNSHSSKHKLFNLISIQFGTCKMRRLNQLSKFSRIFDWISRIFDWLASNWNVSHLMAYCISRTGPDWTGLDWTSKTRTNKTRTSKTRTSKTRTSKTRTSKTRTSKTRTCKTRTSKTRTFKTRTSKNEMKNCYLN